MKRKQFVPIQPPSKIEVIDGEWSVDREVSGGTLYSSGKYNPIRVAVDEVVAYFLQGEERYIQIPVDGDDRKERSRRIHAYGSAARRYFAEKYSATNARFKNHQLIVRTLDEGAAVGCRIVSKS